MKIGLISDTHGLLRDEAIEALAGVDHILHAGDVGQPEVLERLREVAPLDAIKGNVDTDPWSDDLPTTNLVELAGASFYLVHSIDWLDIDPKAAGVDIVVCGHSHAPAMSLSRGVYTINPGSAGPRRFSLPVTLALLCVADGVMESFELKRIV
jgi:putative phosphoesterase